MEDAAKKDFFPNVMETRIVNEKIYGVPIDVVPLAMYYSPKAFEEAGLSESDIPKTWDQFLEIAHKLTKRDRFGCLFETAPGIYQNLTWYPFMWQGDGEIVTPDGKRCAFASPATVQALKFWQDAIQQNVAPRNILGGGGWDVVANLASGFCAMQNLSITGVSALRDNAKDFQYGVFPFPYLPTADKELSWVDGPSSPMPGVRILRRRRGSVFGQWVPCRTTAFKESLTGVPRQTAWFRRENRLWIKGPPKEGTAAPR
jgi:multiple sugar transport system substrate-binding protein